MAWVLIVIFLFTGCFLFPPKVRYSSYLVPEVREQEGDYLIEADGSLSYVKSGLKINVKYVMDDELNSIFSKESSKNEYSINPYTYGNWIDPELGYSPNRFTVFKVSVYNYAFSKIELNPLNCILLTDEGKLLYSYGIEGPVPHNSFEKYYRSLRGQSGNEYYRFNMRMGIVRSYNYGENEKIFKGENYNGFIVFDSLGKDVERVRFRIKDFVLKFDAFDRPLDKSDFSFDFRRKIETKKVLEEEEIARKTEVVSQGLSEIKGNMPGDIYRNPPAINSYIDERSDEISRCFSREFEEGKAVEGKIVVRFMIEPNGAVTGSKILESTVGSEVVENCILRTIGKWSFIPTSPDAFDVTVVYPFEFVVATKR